MGAAPSARGFDLSEPAFSAGPGCRATRFRFHCCCVCYQLILFVPVYGREPTGFQKDTKCQSDRSLATLAAEGEQLVKTRERWKFNFLTIRTSPS